MFYLDIEAHFYHIRKTNVLVNHNYYVNFFIRLIIMRFKSCDYEIKKDYDIKSCEIMRKNFKIMTQNDIIMT